MERSVRGRFPLLFETFFRGLFESDLIPDDVDLRHTAIVLGTVFLGPAMFIGMTLMFKGTWLETMGVSPETIG